MSLKRRQKQRDDNPFLSPGTPPSIARSRLAQTPAADNLGPTPDPSPQPRKQTRPSLDPPPQRGKSFLFRSISPSHQTLVQVALVLLRLASRVFSSS